MTETEKYAYQAGPEVIAELGKMHPFGNRVLMRAIMFSEGYRGELTLVEYNSSDAECFEILAIGGNVARWCEEHGEQAPRAGQHCDIRSTAADRVAQKDPTGRYWLVDVADIASIWDPVDVSEDLMRATEAIKQRQSWAKAAAVAKQAALGMAELVPGR